MFLTSVYWTVKQLAMAGSFKNQEVCSLLSYGDPLCFPTPYQNLLCFLTDIVHIILDLLIGLCKCHLFMRCVRYPKATPLPDSVIHLEDSQNST